MSSKDLPDEFFQKLCDTAKFLKCNPIDLASVMMSESGISPKAWNRSGDASGLIQFMPSTLRSMKWTLGPEAFRELTAVEQLSWVKQYYASYVPQGLDSAARLYLATFLPALLWSKDSRQLLFILCGASPAGPLAWAYAANKVFDRDAKGWITVGDLQMAIDRACHGPRWDEVVIRIKKLQFPLPFDLADDDIEDTEPSIQPLSALQHIEGVLGSDDDGNLS